MERPFRVLFVCLGNAIRSQMAEAFARRYGSDVMVARSAGLTPAGTVMPLTRKVMEEKNIDLEDAYPKSVADHGGEPFDLVVNISGVPLPASKAPVREWRVKDPMGGKEEAYRQAAEEIERMVMDLILELRRLRKKWLEEFHGQRDPRGRGAKSG
jgi:arsenate reductase